MGKLNKDGVNCRWGSADVIAWCYPDQLRQLFLNLILNSVEAFAGRKTAGRRNVTMRVDPIGNQLYHRLIYSDNAGGLDIGKLRLLPRYTEENVKQFIFEEDVTTKEEGSGWGLKICRIVMDLHKGSIDLGGYRGGVTFEISLPKEPVKDAAGD